MRRYLYNIDFNTLPKEEYDVLICGSGIAGLYAAINIHPSKKTAVISKVSIESSNSWLAQGGIAAVIAKDDNLQSHVDDTLRAGAGLCDLEAVKVLVQEGPENIKALSDMNVPFDTNPEGDLQITREGGHSFRRIVHCGGDATGRETTKRLGQIALAYQNINFLYSTYLVDIITKDIDGVSTVIGAIVDGNQGPKLILCKNIILCTGGIGHLYQYTTNPRASNGEGIAAAYRCGAEVKDMEMVQFHPTTLYAPTKEDRLFLISEAVRGEGGKLINSKGERFMVGEHELAELAPRDIVTRGILKELMKSGETVVYLDNTSMTEEFFKNRFPTIFEGCKKFGINIPHDHIPVRPAQHYHMGGIKTDLNGMTNINGLYAAGECACTGIHGANRLASNSVLECLVFGKRAADSINKRNDSDLTLKDITLANPNINYNTQVLSDEEIESYYKEIRKTMTKYVSAVRKKDGLHTALETLENMYEKIKHIDTTKHNAFELYSMCVAAILIVKAALARNNSVGAHYVID